MQEYFYRDDTRFQLWSKLDEIIGRHVDEKIPPFENDEARNKYIENVRDRLDNFDYKGYEDAEFDLMREDEILLADVIYPVRQEANQFLEERQSYIPMAGRVLAAYEYLHGDGEFSDYQIPEFNPTAFLGRALKMHTEHGEDYDLELAHSAANSALQLGYFEGLGFTDAEKLVDYLQVRPEVVNSFANGATVDKALDQAEMEYSEVVPAQQMEYGR